LCEGHFNYEDMAMLTMSLKLLSNSRLYLFCLIDSMGNSIDNLMMMLLLVSSDFSIDLLQVLGSSRVGWIFNTCATLGPKTDGVRGLALAKIYGLSAKFMLNPTLDGSDFTLLHF